MFCKHCGREIANEAVICIYCGCSTDNNQQTPPPPVQHSGGSSAAPIVLGIVGIVMAWLLAIIGHITSIIGIVLGAKEYKATGNVAGLVVSIIGEVCSVISSALGVIMMSNLMY